MVHRLYHSLTFDWFRVSRFDNASLVTTEDTQPTYTLQRTTTQAINQTITSLYALVGAIIHLQAYLLACLLVERNGYTWVRDLDACVRIWEDSVLEIINMFRPSTHKSESSSMCIWQICIWQICIWQICYIIYIARKRSKINDTSG